MNEVIQMQKVVILYVKELKRTLLLHSFDRSVNLINFFPNLGTAAEHNKQQHATQSKTTI